MARRRGEERGKRENMWRINVCAMVCAHKGHLPPCSRQHLSCSLPSSFPDILWSPLPISHGNSGMFACLFIYLRQGLTKQSWPVLNLLHRSGWPLNSQRSSCFCLPSTGIKRLQHQVQQTLKIIKNFWDQVEWHTFVIPVLEIQRKIRSSRPAWATAHVKNKM